MMGTIKVFTGEGKGKTTEAFGLAWMAIGRGMKVFIVQFLKAPETSGEQLAARAFGSMLIVKPMGRKGFIRDRVCEPQDAAMAKRGLEEAFNAVLSGEYGVVILDEINLALHFGLVDLEAILELMDRKPENMDLVLTGRYAHPEIVERADCVVEMKKVKHHSDRGAKSRKGIEY